MSGLPQVSGERLIRALLRCGFVELRRTGGHAILRHETDLTRRATIPLHGGRDIKSGTLRAILKSTGIGVQELRDLL